MSATYTVQAVGDPREWKNDYGAFLAYPVDLTDSEGNPYLGIEWSRKKDSKPPLAGDKIVADIQAGPHGEKLKVDFDATKELKGGTSSSGGADYGRGKRPDETASIHRQVALKILAPRINDDGLNDSVKATVEEIEDFIQAAGGVGKENASAQTQANPSPSQDPDIQGTSERLSSLLEENGVNGAAARVVTDYLLSERSPEEQDTAIHRLENPNTAAACVKRFSELAEQHSGEPLPSEPPDEEIPF